MTMTLVRALRRRSGQALVACLLVVAFMTMMLGTMSLGFLLEGRLATLQGDALQAHYLARAGLEAGADVVRRDDPSFDCLGDDWSARAADLYKVVVAPGYFDVARVSPDESTRKPGIVDEESKLNVNRADVAALTALDPEVTQQIAGAIVARRAERPFASLGEMETLPEVPQGLFERARPDLPGGLAELMTVHGDGRVNVATAPRAVLLCLGTMTKELADKLIKHRDGPDGRPGTADDGALRDMAQVQQALGLSDEAFARLAPQITLASSHFTITASGWVDGEPMLLAELREVVRRDADGLTVLRFEDLR